MRDQSRSQALAHHYRRQLCHRRVVTPSPSGNTMPPETEYADGETVSILSATRTKTAAIPFDLPSYIPRELRCWVQKNTAGMSSTYATNKLQRQVFVVMEHSREYRQTRVEVLSGRCLVSRKLTVFLYTTSSYADRRGGLGLKGSADIDHSPRT